MTMDFRHQTSTLHAATATGILTIDFSALRDNYLTLAARAQPAKTSAVVKANGYGLGADLVATVLYGAGCRTFFVAHFSEALRLRPSLSSDTRLFVLTGLMPGDETLCADLGIIPVLNSLEQADSWAAEAKARGITLPAALQVDTGMARLGMSPDEIAAVKARPERLDGIRLTHILSHLARADEPGHTASEEARLRMHTAMEAFPGVPMCLANSGGIFLGDAFHGALCRPGIALYGGSPAPHLPNPVKPVVSLDVAVVQVRTVAAGTPVGYGGSHVTSRETRVATIAAGYADGLPRSLSDRGAVWFGDIRLPMLGRVSMDSITVDATDLPDGALSRGSLVEVIGPHQALEDIAADAGTISYEILTGLGDRYRRVYRYPDMDLNKNTKGQDA